MRVVPALPEMLHRTFVTCPPVNRLLLVGEYFGKCSSPAAAADDPKLHSMTFQEGTKEREKSLTQPACARRPGYAHLNTLFKNKRLFLNITLFPAQRAFILQEGKLC
jgi:hypothetical protein